ncbi:unnamed protein product, partial [Amoebophrya sp. A120]
FEIQHLLGRGGTAEVYQAHRKGFNFALKVVKAQDRRQLASFQQEHVVRCYGSKCDAPSLRIFILLEYADCDFQLYQRDVFSRQNANFMPLPMILHCFTQMVAAVRFIHSKNILHFDLKPANFLLFNQRTKIKLSDFGLARVLEHDKTHVSRDGHCGTVLYMAPEAFHQGEQYESSMKMKSGTDVWSLGIILYAMIYGRPP